MILDGVVSAAIQVLCDLCPSVPQGLVSEEEEPLLMVTPVLLLDIRIEVVVPSLAALLADTSYFPSCIPGRFSEMVVHFCAPYFWTNLMR